ncbi:NYN domain-containing protein [Patescibacteria group bacterium]|nr:NYN domain-containing protein [Patescibacteria group bacterium]MCG2695162.1 NYN domain-containing protein [Candidatus Parcubacteria bacterium]
MVKKEEEKPKKISYGAESIQILEGLEPVRKRPGMYIGTTGPEGLHHLIWEIFDNARDEAMGGHADTAEIILLPGNRIRVTDNGRGIPVDIHKQTKVSALETIMTTLHAGGKFGGEGYQVSGGLHGVGASVVNALSAYTKVVVHRDGGAYMQEYAQGKKKASVKKIGTSKEHGTIVTFEADPVIFPEIEYDFKKITGHLRQQAYLVKGMRVVVVDAREYEEEIDDSKVFFLKELGLNIPSMTFCFEGGLLSLVKFYNQTQKPVHKNIFYIEKSPDGVEGVEVALQYVDDISSRIVSFANNTSTPEGGTHLTGFKTALTRALNAYGRKNGILKEKDENFTGDDVLEGLTAVVSVKLREVQFEGQTKSKLGTVEARGMVESVFSEGFNMFLEENPDDAKAMINKVILALRARKAAKAAKDSVLRKGALEGMTLPGKLADCSTRKAEDSELFIVEGDSAGGCFSGDTKVALLDGRNLSFEDLVREHKEGKENYCYTIGENGNTEVALIENPRKTKINAKVIKVILDNDEEIICTPDHKFMLSDGTYKQAIELKEENLLKSNGKNVKNKQKVGVFVDASNTYYSEKRAGWKIDYEKLQSFISQEFSVEFMKYYVAIPKESDVEAYNGKINYLEKIKNVVEVIEKPLKYIREKIVVEGKSILRIIKKGDVDVEIVVDAINNASDLDAIIILSGDSDYVVLRDDLLKKGTEVLFIAHKRNLAHEIKQGKYLVLSMIRENIEFNGKKQTPVKDGGILVPLLYPNDNNKSSVLDGNVNNLSEKEYKVKRVKIIEEKMDVYDLEVKGTHNFALAGGVFVHNSAKQGRDRATQAILPLRGKILNVERARLDRMLASQEIKNLVVALGTAIGDTFDIEKLRYHKVIIATDADVDGAHISTLLLTLFYRHFKALIENGHIYLAQPPLYKIKHGKTAEYVYTDEEKEAYLKKIGVDLSEDDFVEEDGSEVSEEEGDEENEDQKSKTKKAPKVHIQRYKGLGEMNPEELFETTMDPEKRILKRVTIEDGEESDRVFDKLMGSEVAPRKNFIQTNAKMANIDV